MTFDIIVTGPLGVNCFVLGCEKTMQGLVVDPGGDVDLIMASIKEHGLNIVGIINTHGHFDHVGGNREMLAQTGAPLWIHPADAPMLGRVAQVSAMYGLPGGENSPDADHQLEDGAVLTFGDCSARVIHTPGHTPGGCCLYLESENKVITGDTLFADGVGRTDLPGGSHIQLVDSIKTKLFLLPDTTEVWPGHGPGSTIGHEKRHNPYLD